METELKSLIIQLQNIQNGKLWIGENFEKKLNHISEKTAFIKTQEDFHSIAEIISHLSVWKKEAILKIETGKGLITDDLEVNWLKNKQLKDVGWLRVLEDYRNISNDLIDLLKQKDASFLDEIYYDTDYKGNYSYRFLIEGMLHHDIYHLGQLGIVLKMIEKE